MINLVMPLADGPIDIILGDFTAPVDAVHFLYICQATHAVAKPYAVAIAFALTRPCCGGLTLRLKQWVDIWDVCASLVDSQGLDVSAWGHATEVALNNELWSARDGGYETSQRETAFLCDPKVLVELTDILIEEVYDDGSSASDGTATCPGTAWILLCNGEITPKDMDFSVLTILSNGHFAIVHGQSRLSDFSTQHQTITMVRLDSNLQMLMPRFRQDRGGRLHLHPVQRIGSGTDDYDEYHESAYGEFANDLLRKICTNACESSLLMRRAADGIAYSFDQFYDWYVGDRVDGPSRGGILLRRWNEAAPCNPTGDRFAAMVRNQQEFKIKAPISHKTSSVARIVGSTQSADDSCLGDVLEVVEHQEPAAVINGIEAEEIVALQSGTFIERGIATLLPQNTDSDSEPDEALFLCKLNRVTSSLREAFCEGIPLRQCRAALVADGHNWQLPGGALIFVQPWQYRPAMRALVSTELHPDHLIISSSIEHLVQETMEMPIRGSGSWVKARRQLNIENVDSVAASASEPSMDESCEYELVIARTFINALPKRQHAAEVNQSTTEADSRKGLNPRRAISDQP